MALAITPIITFFSFHKLLSLILSRTLIASLTSANASCKTSSIKVNAVNAILDGQATIVIHLYVLLHVLWERVSTLMCAAANQDGQASFAVLEFANLVCMGYVKHLKFVNASTAIQDQTA